MPKFDLAAVHAAARGGRVECGGPRYKLKLLPLLGEYLRVIDFTQEVLLELKAEDFLSSPVYSGLVHDTYGVCISSALQKRFDVEGLETWYVKFTVDEEEDGGLVIMASLHEPTEPLKRMGGTIPVRFTRRRGS